MVQENFKKKIGQQFIVSLAGTSLDPQEVFLIDEFNIGGVILFKHNIESLEQLVGLINDLQSYRKDHPFFVAIDQEYGPVHRLSDEFTKFPGAEDLCKTDSPKLAFDLGDAIADELTSVGINVNFAPVLDILSNPDNPAMKHRCMGTTPEQVMKLGSGVIRGMQKAGLIACGKHFPGHGDTSVDSHEEMPVLTHSFKALEDRELLPFRRAIRTGVEMLMTSHIKAEAFDKEFPVTMSKAAVDFLRNDFRFTKVLVTDDIGSMKAITDNYSMAEAAVGALKAGHDAVVMRASLDDQRACLEAVDNALKTGEYSPRKMEESFQRIVELKQRYINDDRLAVSSADSKVGSEKSKEVVASFS
jgi:beta-N-acetylhexosaminidase